MLKQEIFRSHVFFCLCVRSIAGLYFLRCKYQEACDMYKNILTNHNAPDRKDLAALHVYTTHSTNQSCCLLN